MYSIKFILNSKINFIDMPFVPRVGEGVNFRFRETKDNAIFCKVCSVNYWITDGNLDSIIEVTLEDIDQ